MLESISQTDTSADLKHNRFNWNPKVSWEYEQSRKGKKKKSNNLEKVNHREISEELEISRPLCKRKTKEIRDNWNVYRIQKEWLME